MVQSVRPCPPLGSVRDWDRRRGRVIMIPRLFVADLSDIIVGLG